MVDSEGIVTGWLEDAKKNAGLIVGLGVVTVIAGFLALVMPWASGVGVALFVGLAFVVGGVARLIGAFSAGSFGRGTLAFIGGALTLLAGVIMVARPGIGLATLTGFFVASKPFFRTPKRAHKHALLQALGAAREEALLSAALCLAALGIIVTFGTESLDLLMWTIMLLLQATPYAASVIVSIISALPGLPASWIGETGSMQEAAHNLLDPPPAPNRF